MSIEAKKAAFKIKDYKFTDFSFNESFTEGELSIGFLPKGEYLESVGEYYLYFKFIAFKEDDNIPEELEEEMASLNITLKTTFVFDPIVPLVEIPTFFYKNCIAIIFPYLRAFLSTLTLQANVKPLILPLMNLSGLEKPLIENTVLITE